MKFFNSKTNVIFTAIALLLVSAIIFLSGIISEKNSSIKSLENQVSQNSLTIEESNQKLDEINSELEKINSETEKIQSKYEKATKANSSLKTENEKLKKENKNFKKKTESVKTTSKVTSKKTNTKTESKTETKPTYNGKKVCYLTFDDGPSKNTLEILEILEKNDILATFFVMDTKNISYLKKIQKAGHTIGLHTYTHDYATLYKSSDAYFNDLNKISNKVYDITGVKSKIIRFPGGSSNQVSRKYSGKKLMPTLIKQVTKKGYYYFDWNVDSTDASGNNVSYTKIRDSVLSSAKGKNSICVLMHDSESKKSTVTALPGIIKGLKKQGFTFKPLTEKSSGYHHNVS